MESNVLVRRQEGSLVFEVPESVRTVFETAGWYPGRRVDVILLVTPDHPSAAILAALSGLEQFDCLPCGM